MSKFNFAVEQFPNLRSTKLLCTTNFCNKQKNNNASKKHLNKKQKQKQIKEDKDDRHA